MMLITAAVISAPALASLTGAALAVGDGRAVADGETLGETLADGAGVLAVYPLGVNLDRLAAAGERAIIITIEKEDM